MATSKLIAGDLHLFLFLATASRTSSAVSTTAPWRSSLWLGSCGCTASCAHNCWRGGPLHTHNCRWGVLKPRTTNEELEHAAARLLSWVVELEFAGGRRFCGARWATEAPLRAVTQMHKGKVHVCNDGAICSHSKECSVLLGR